MVAASFIMRIKYGTCVLKKENVMRLSSASPFDGDTHPWQTTGHIWVNTNYGTQGEQQNGGGETGQVHDRAVVLPGPAADHRGSRYDATTHHQDRAGQALV